MEKQSISSVELKEKIDLTEKEREIFDRLLGTLRFCNLDTQLRVAGGWVRDKVLFRYFQGIVSVSGFRFSTLK